jgi:polysaccharide biosynthesis transport protein
MIPSTNQYGVVPRPASPSWVVANRTATPVVSFFAHRRLAYTVIAAVLLVGLVAALLYGRNYLAEATVRVSPVLPSSLETGDSRFSSNIEYRDFVQEQVFEINSYATVSAALDLLGPKRWLWQRSGESNRHAAERLIWNLKVEAVPDSYLIRIDLDGRKPDGLADIVNAVAKSYLSRAAKRELEGADVGFQLLAAHETELERSIATDEGQLSGLTQELGVSSVDGALVNPYDKLLADSNSALARARRNVLTAQAHLDAVKTHRERIKNADVEAKAEQVAATTTDATTARQQLIQQREQALFELSGLGPNHPGRRALEAQIETANKELANLDQSALDRARSMLSDSEQATTSVDISEAESNLEQMQSSEKGIEKELASVKATAAAVGSKYSLAVSVHEKVGRERKELQDLQERISVLRLKTEAPGVVALETAAMTPDVPQKSTRRLIFAAFVLGSILLGIMVPTMVDLTDRKIKTSDEFEDILGFPPLGIAMGSNGNGKQAMRRIALGIMREWRTSGIRSYILTSVRDGSNDYIAHALAGELSDLGVRTLAIKASLNGSNGSNGSNGHQLKPPAVVAAPSVASLPGRTTKRLAPRVANTVALDRAGQPMPPAVGDTSLQRAQNGGVPSTFGYVRETVEHALGNHDIVLMAAPPLLSSADSIALIQMPAGAILVARTGHDDVSEITAAIRELERCVPPVVGAIIVADNHKNGNGQHPFDLDFDATTPFAYGLAGK